MPKPNWSTFATVIAPPISATNFACTVMHSEVQVTSIMNTIGM